MSDVGKENRQKMRGGGNGRGICGEMEDGRQRAQTGLKNTICPLRSQPAYKTSLLNTASVGETINLS